MSRAEGPVHEAGGALASAGPAPGHPRPREPRSAFLARSVPVGRSFVGRAAQIQPDKFLRHFFLELTVDNLESESFNQKNPRAPPHGKMEGQRLPPLGRAGPGWAGTRVRSLGPRGQSRFPPRRDWVTLLLGRSAWSPLSRVLPRNSRGSHDTGLSVSERPRDNSVFEKRRRQREDVAGSVHLARCEQREGQCVAPLLLENSKRNFHAPVISQ